MLFILTGDVQTGKTRWLECLLADLAADGVEGRGVVAPGVWRQRTEDETGGEHPLGSGEGAFEKLGIDNVLLPQGERIAFARRRDLAERDGMLDPASQSAAAQLAWEIPDEAIARVNGHFRALAGLSAENKHSNTIKGTNVSHEASQRLRPSHTRSPEDAPTCPSTSPTRPPSTQRSSASPDAAAARPAEAAGPWLLVVDELGRLELERGCGLTAALDLLERGPTAACPHALVVVRARLHGRAEERFAAAWGGCAALVPGDEARSTVRRAFGLASLIDNEYH